MKARFRYTRAGRPAGGSEHDCVIRSLAVFFGWTYAHAQEIANAVSEGEVAEEGLTLDRWEQLLAGLGLAEVRFASETPVVMAADRLQDALILIDCEPAHIFACRGGVIYDMEDSRFIGIDPNTLTFTRTAWISPAKLPARRKTTCKKTARKK